MRLPTVTDPTFASFTKPLHSGLRRAVRVTGPTRLLAE
jgi:hypothetical protein